MITNPSDEQIRFMLLSNKLREKAMQSRLVSTQMDEKHNIENAKVCAFVFDAVADMIDAVLQGET